MTATFVYDGDCAFCTSCARFIRRWVPTPAVVVPWQFADLARLGLAEAACVDAVQWVEAPTGPGTGSGAGTGDPAGAPLAGAPLFGAPLFGASLAGPDAIAALLRTSHRGWRLVGWLLRRRPVRALAWPGYRWVARNRHRLPGGTAACALPRDP